MTPLRQTSEKGPDSEGHDNPKARIEIRLPMLRKSLMVLYGKARYDWEHAIPRDAIETRRIALTMRELTAEFGEGGVQAEVGQSVLDIALTFGGTVLS